MSRYADESPRNVCPSVREHVADVQDRVTCVRVVVLPDPPVLTVVTRVSTYQPGEEPCAHSAGANEPTRHVTRMSIRIPRNLS